MCGGASHRARVRAQRRRGWRVATNDALITADWQPPASRAPHERAQADSKRRLNHSPRLAMHASHAHSPGRGRGRTDGRTDASEGARSRRRPTTHSAAVSPQSHDPACDPAALWRGRYARRECQVSRPGPGVHAEPARVHAGGPRARLVEGGDDLVAIAALAACAAPAERLRLPRVLRLAPQNDHLRRAPPGDGRSRRHLVQHQAR